ncbi:hypothetical protein PVK06_046645 [Gossypium arboreum]|uniref:Uncharacterized protein n=1 Tax=Gossypium arboreum TaxID=29729 RepID=A0ABR0MD76_GOSAR|nr:hypothetical protein PVK06_046645 [Gossypium arboreum]
MKVETKINLLPVFSLHNYKISLSIIVLTNQFGSFNNLVHKHTSLEDLTSCDLWQSTLNKVSLARSLNLLINPHDHLIYLTYNILTLSKLHCFTDSSNKLYTLNDLNDYHTKHTLHFTQTSLVKPEVAIFHHLIRPSIYLNSQHR